MALLRPPGADGVGRSPPGQSSGDHCQSFSLSAGNLVNLETRAGPAQVALCLHMWGAEGGGLSGVFTGLPTWGVGQPPGQVFPACRSHSGAPCLLPECPKYLSRDPVSSLEVTASIALAPAPLLESGWRPLVLVRTPCCRPLHPQGSSFSSLGTGVVGGGPGRGPGWPLPLAGPLPA